jgi:hypothetical protein
VGAPSGKTRIRAYRLLPREAGRDEIPILPVESADKDGHLDKPQEDGPETQSRGDSPCADIDKDVAPCGVRFEATDKARGSKGYF